MCTMWSFTTKQKCCTRIYAKAIFKTNKEPISFILFDDKLNALYQLNNKESSKIFELTDKEIEEALLPIQQQKQYCPHQTEQE